MYPLTVLIERLFSVLMMGWEYGATIGLLIWCLYALIGPCRDQTMPERTRRRYRGSTIICGALAVAFLLLKRKLDRLTSLLMVLANMPSMALLAIAVSCLLRRRRVDRDDPRRSRFLRKAIVCVLIAALLNPFAAALLYGVWDDIFFSHIDNIVAGMSP